MKRETVAVIPYLGETRGHSDILFSGKKNLQKISQTSFENGKSIPSLALFQ